MSEVVPDSLERDAPVRHPTLGIGRVLLDNGTTVVVRFPHGIEECERDSLQPLATLDIRQARPTWDVPLEVINRAQAEAIRSVNDTWGAFAPSRIELLPHQLWVCRQVTSEWPTRWLIADDVGLGKTVEAGMVLSALMSRDRLRRVLILCPASLVPQWQQRMKQMFDLRFTLYTTEADTARADFWGTHDYVVASLHTLRLDHQNRQDRLIESEPWDLVLADEAHHLNADEEAGPTLGYRLVRRLVEQQRVQSMLFFTGTPHRGKNYGFLALLQLLRSDLFDPKRPLAEQLGELPRVMIRNNKSNVTDLQGDRLFQPLAVTSQTYSYSPAEERFYHLLTEFIVTGRAYAARLPSTEGRAVMLVLIALQKLASSSVAAIRRTLRGRLRSLAAGRERLQALRDLAARLAAYERLETEGTGEELAQMEEKIAELSSELRLMEDEEPALRQLLAAADRVGDETKIQTILGLVEGPFAGRSVLFFTEYKATQSLLMSALMERFGADCVTFINGDGRAEDVLLPNGKTETRNEAREVAAERFNSGAVRFLVSTEAAGEGIDLQERAYTLVHVDLPWNPMRMHQRVGRLNRYGQRHRVEVVTIRNPDTIESLIWDKLQEKLERITIAHGRVMEEPEDMQQLVLGMTSSGFFRELFAEGSMQSRDSLAQWFDQRTARFGGQDVVQTVRDMIGHVNRFDFGQASERLPRVDLPDLRPFLEVSLTLNNRRLREDDDGLFFLTPESWRSDPMVPSEYHGLIFDRRYRGSDVSKRLLGAGHRVLDLALSQAVGRDALTSTLPREVLPRPLLIFRLHDRITGQAQGARSIVSGVEFEPASGDFRLLLDWQVLRVLNELPYRRTLMSAPAPAPSDGDRVQEVLSRGTAYFEAHLAETGHTFRRPEHELLALLWPVSDT